MNALLNFFKTFLADTIANVKTLLEANAFLGILAILFLAATIVMFLIRICDSYYKRIPLCSICLLLIGIVIARFFPVQLLYSLIAHPSEKTGTQLYFTMITISFLTVGFIALFSWGVSWSEDRDEKTKKLIW